MREFTMSTLRVTRITVEYVDKGQRFSIDFDPDTVESLVFSLNELAIVDKGVAIQATGTPPSASARPLKFFETTAPLGAQTFTNGEKPGAESVLIGAASGSVGAASAGRGLWWYSGGSWFHPQ